MDMRGKRQASSIFGGMGFYIALLVCVIAAGVVGYYALLNDGEDPETTIDPPIIDTVDAVTGGESTPVTEPDGGDMQLVLSEEPHVTHPVTVPVNTEDGTEPEGDTAETGSTEILEIPVSGEDEIPEVPVPESTGQPVSSKIVAPLMGDTVAVFSVDQLMYDATLGDWHPRWDRYLCRGRNGCGCHRCWHGDFCGRGWTTGCHSSGGTSRRLCDHLCKSPPRDTGCCG